MLGFSNPFKNISRVIKEGMTLFSRVPQVFSDNKALRTYSPETEKIIERLMASGDGEFVMNSGVLSPEEIAKLSRLQLANFLIASTRMIEMFGTEVLMIPETREGLLKSLSKLEKTKS
jgi:hypothetical protein